MTNYDWLLKRTPRSVDQLRLWPENPRLNPDTECITLMDFAEDLTYENGDKEDFKRLVNSIVDEGFIPAEPIVVWKDKKNEKFYVAEGNRRVVALKLLREPRKSPKSIRSFIQGASKKADLKAIEKIPVSVAPSLDDAEWYINQRNSASSLQRRWTRVQQQRWLQQLYEKHNGDIEIIASKTKISRSDLEGFIRILRIKDFIKIDAVKSKLSEKEYQRADSYRFPITILERFFSFVDVKEAWGIEYEGIDISIKNESSFFNAYAELIKRIVNESDDQINTRLKKEDLPDILSSFPEVSTNSEMDEASSSEVIESENIDDENTENKTGESVQPVSEPPSKRYQHLKGDRNRNRILLPIYALNTDNARLKGLFKELKEIPPQKYENSVAASFRVFLDLSVRNYVIAEGLETEIKKKYQKDFRNITLKQRLEYLKQNHVSKDCKKIIGRLLDQENPYSLDVLNGYMHGAATHYLNKQFLNGFWDFLFPLFEYFLDIKEENV